MPTDPFATIGWPKRLLSRWRRWTRTGLRLLLPSRLNASHTGPPNLLVLAVDTLRLDHLHFGGYQRPTSPVLDDLASRATTFADVMAPAPWTLPSFASSLTGVMPCWHGAVLGGSMRNMDQQPPRRLSTLTPTLAGHLARMGYRTAAFYANPFFAFGLAESFQRRTYLNLPAGELAFWALEWIRRHADRPFFCFVLLNDPHEPTIPPRTYRQPFLRELIARGISPGARQLRALARWGDCNAGTAELGREVLPLSKQAAETLAVKLALYDGTIAYVDTVIGGILQQLSRWELAGKTVVSIYADHGEEFLDHAAEARRWDHDPRRVRAIGHGHSLFQELLHVPWITTGPSVPGPARVTTPVSLCDVAPTLADWLGVDPFPVPACEPASLVGRSLVSAAAAAAAAKEGTGSAGPLQRQERRLVAEDLAYGPDLVAIREGAWKMIATRAGEPLALYQLAGDPHETQDRRADRPEIVARLQQALAAHNSAAAPRQSGGAGPASWQEVSAKVRQRLKDLGYTD
jgi:arylsulfatase A-like enzyme